MRYTIDPAIEAFVESELDEALADYAKILPPNELAIMRAALRDELLFHPDGQRLVRAAMDDPSVDRSAKVGKDADDSIAEVASKREAK